MPFVSVMTPCYNEEHNVEDLYRQVKDAISSIPGYTYEHIFIDNASRDGTATALRRLAAMDQRVRVILNTRNFGHLRSPHHALLQARGEAVIALAADLQDPPALIPEFLKKWEEGYKVVMGVKTQSDESPVIFRLRKLYYRFLGKISNVELVENYTGFGLYDREVIELMRRVDDPYPYFRGLISDIGFEAAKIPFRQPVRKQGFTSNNFYTWYDLAILGITNHSKVPLRLASMLGFFMSFVTFVIALGYLVAKLLFWSRFSFGLAPILIGLFFLASVQLFFIGIIGEYIGTIFTQVQKRPLVVEKERINFPVDRPRQSPDPHPASTPSGRASEQAHDELGS